MVNGDGIRVVLWVSGCEHYCKGCHNQCTWDKDHGLEFTEVEYDEVCTELNKDYVQGLTVSGGDPLALYNRGNVTGLVKRVKARYPNKDIWVYTGYTWEDVKGLEVMQYIDVLVDGKYIDELASVSYKWAGSTNQRVIDVKSSLLKGCIVEYTY